MPQFLYTARDRAGNVLQGRIDAVSDSRAAADLREQGLWVTDLRPAGGASRRVERSSEDRELLRRSFTRQPLKELSLFYRQLHAMLHSGMGLHSALDTLAAPGQGTTPALRRAVSELALEVLRGGPLSAAMARYPWLFDRLQVRMVEAGEKGGLLVSVLERLADYLEREYQLRMEISKRTLYPKLLLAAFFIIPAVPVLVLSGPIAFLRTLWGNVSWLLLFGVPIYLAMRIFLQTRGGREAYDRVKLAIPIIGPLVRKLAIARFGRMLAALYGAGVPIASAMQVAAESSGNAVLESAGARIVPSLQAGNSIALTMQATGFFPPMIVGMVATGESTGSLDATLDKASQFYEEEALHSSVRLVVVMGVLLLLAVAVLIGIRVIGFYTGMYGGIAGGAPGE